MTKAKDNRKPVFTALATIQDVEGVKKVVMTSAAHWQQQVRNLSLGKKYGVTVEEYKATRSDEQLKYYWVLLKYIADETGHTSEELHDALMRQKFGVKIVEVGPVRQEVRRSIANTARFPTSDMVELIQETLDLCQTLGIHVPTKTELGYLPS